MIKAPTSPLKLQCQCGEIALGKNRLKGALGDGPSPQAKHLPSSEGTTLNNTRLVKPRSTKCNYTYRMLYKPLAKSQHPTCCCHYGNCSCITMVVITEVLQRLPGGMCQTTESQRLCVEQPSLRGGNTAWTGEHGLTENA